MSATARDFTAGSQSTMEELVRVQVKLGGDAGISQARSQLIASQIVEQVTNKLKTQMATKQRKYIRLPQNKNSLFVPAQ